MKTPQCDLCGCAGNSECGCEPVDKVNFCTLDGAGICPCCAKIGLVANKLRWNKNDKQTEMVV